ncbi:MAG: DUF4388 domain-containing protein [Limnothrix sp. RL_2_0]|nr:DUF4388 domain-containing protein [Limnothrix sp. RL_2_0]
MFGSLSDFSLGELFQVLEQGEKTGRLTIYSGRRGESQKDRISQTPPRNYYIWFRRGFIVAAANSLDNQGLSKLIDQRSWIEGGTSVLAPGFCNVNLPLGICFKSHGLITAEQLKLLFSVQVLRQVCQLFTLLHGRYHFDEKAPLAYPEMTGLSAPATDVTLAGLRNLKDWSALEDKLPEPDSAILSLVEGKPHLKLNQSELRVWEFADGTVALKDVAARLDLSLEKVRKIAFRLSVVNLAEEFPLLISASDMMNLSLDDEFVDDENNLFFMEEQAVKAEAPVRKSNSQEFIAPPPMSDDFLQELMRSLNNS